MGENNINPGFINDDGKANYGSSLAVGSKEQTKRKDNGSYVLELKDLRKAEEAGEYNPYFHREVKHPTTNVETFLHLLKGSLGTGILSMPLAFYHSGYALGIVGTLVIGGICTYCIHMLIQAEYEMCKRRKVPSMSYTETAEAALLDGPPIMQKLAPYSVHAINTFLLIYQMGSGCIYTVFIADNVKDVADYYIGDIDVKIWMLIFLLPLIFINYIKSLKLLAPLSTLANFITIGSFGIILYYLIDADMTFEGREPIGKPADFPLFLGTVLFALEAIGVILPLENEMKTPKSFGGSIGILNIAMVTIVSLYVGMGLMGYLAYGANVEKTITLNLGTAEAIPAQMVRLMLAFSIFITHPLQMYVAIDIAWDEYLGRYFEKNDHQAFWNYTVRTVQVLITFALAVAVPRLDLFISLFGAFCLSALGLAFPAIIQTCTYWHSLSGLSGSMLLLKNFCIVLFGVGGLIIGTSTSLQKIIESFDA